MMADYLLDSDAIIDHLKAKAGAVSFLQQLFRRGERLLICGVVVAEVYAGLSAVERGSVAELIDAFTFAPTSPAIAALAGIWRHQFARQGVSLATTDMLIAATAHLYGATLVTGNLKHYPIPELSILPLPRPVHDM